MSQTKPIGAASASESTNASATELAAASAAMAAPPSSKKKVVTGEFIVTEQPLPKFFKDEGGKKNCLIAWVKAANLKVDGAQLNVEAMIPALASICYESGETVEDKHQYIFRVANGKQEGSRVFSVPANGSATRLLFRIEKVSRRFDSRKFIVKISAHESASSPKLDFRHLEWTTTTPIEVFSKRKVKNIDPGQSFGRMRPRTSQNCTRAAMEGVEAGFAEEFRDLREMFSMQQTQMESVMNLLESRKMMGRAKRSRRPEQMHTMTRYRPNMVASMERFPTRGDFSFGPPPPAASALDPRHRH